MNARPGEATGRIKRELPPHGTTARYLRGCRCAPCVHRRRRYNKHSRVRRQLGFRGVVDAAPVARHIASLRAAGASLQAIGDAAGCSQATVLRIERGGAALFASTAARILAVRSAPSATKVSSLGAARRVRALFALGYPLAALSARTGLAATHLSEIANGRRPVVACATRGAVCAAYEALSGTPGPSAYSRAWAARRGWPPPLAWDESAIDDPCAVPDVGGRAPRPLAVAEDAEFIRATTGACDEVIAARMGLSRDTLQVNLARARRARERVTA